MKADISTRPGLQVLTTALLSVAVFCFWGYVRPYLITERELTQMFLWNGDYFMERIAVPGGLARYIGEWLVQFFVYIKYGAAVYALLFALVQLLCWRLTRSYLLSLVLPVLMWWLSLRTSRREDGLYTRLYFSSIDPDGKATKPFLLPQRNPRQYYRQSLFSFNTPDFTVRPVKTNLRQMGRLIESNRRSATTVKDFNTATDK